MTCLQIIKGPLAAAAVVARAGLKVVAAAVKLVLSGVEFAALGAAKAVRSALGAEQLVCGPWLART